MKFKSLETKLKSFFRNNPFELHFEEDEKQGTVDVFGDVSEDILKNLDKNFDNFKRFWKIEIKHKEKIISTSCLKEIIKANKSQDV